MFCFTFIIFSKTISLPCLIQHCKIFKSTYFETHLRTAVTDSSYILHKKLNKIIQEPDWLFVSFWNIKSRYFSYPHLFSFVLSLAVIRCHSLSFFGTRCHSLSLVAIRSHLLYHSLSFAVIPPPPNYSHGPINRCSRVGRKSPIAKITSP